VVRDVLDEVPTLKSRYAHELQVHGSAGLLQTLITHDLIDEYRILFFPVIIGTGKRLFGPGAVPADFTLREQRTTSAGVLYGAYRRSGPLKTGSFALED
jgi:dihydrofolate reductase